MKKQIIFLVALLFLGTFCYPVFAEDKYYISKDNSGTFFSISPRDFVTSIFAKLSFGDSFFTINNGWETKTEGVVKKVSGILIPEGYILEYITSGEEQQNVVKVIDLGSIKDFEVSAKIEGVEIAKVLLECGYSKQDIEGQVSSKYTATVQDSVKVGEVATLKCSSMAVGNGKWYYRVCAVSNGITHCGSIKEMEYRM